MEKEKNIVCEILILLLEFFIPFVIGDNTVDGLRKCISLANCSNVYPPKLKQATKIHIIITKYNIFFNVIISFYIVVII